MLNIIFHITYLSIVNILIGPVYRFLILQLISVRKEMQCEIGNEYCPFSIVKEEIQNRFVHFERILREIRDRLFGEIEQLQREWRRDILNLKKVSQIVGQEIPTNSFVSPSRRRILDSFEVEIQLNLETKPMIQIVWEEFVNILDLTSDSRIAHVTCKDKLSPPRSHSNSFTSGFSSYNLNSETTPVSESSFYFDDIQIKKTHSTSSIQTTEHSEQFNQNYPLLFPIHTTTTTHPKYQTMGGCTQRMAGVTRSLPQSPIMGIRPDANQHRESQRFESTSPVEHNPRQRDVMLLKEEDRKGDSLPNPPAYARQETVIRNPTYKPSEEGRKVSELKKNFEKNS